MRKITYHCPDCKPVYDRAGVFTGYMCASQGHYDLKNMVVAEKPRKARNIDPEMVAIAHDLMAELEASDA
jgi:hypothetical protein